MAVVLRLGFLSIVIAGMTFGCGDTKEEQAKDFFKDNDNADAQAACSADEKFLHFVNGECIEATQVNDGCDVESLKSNYPEYNWAEVEEKVAPDLAAGYEIKNCAFAKPESDETSIGRSFYINMERRKVEEDQARLSRLTVEGVLVHSDPALLDSTRKLLENNKAVVTAVANPDAKICFEFTTFPGTCTSFRIEGTITTEKTEHNCDIATQVPGLAGVSCDDDSELCKTSKDGKALLGLFFVDLTDSRETTFSQDSFEIAVGPQGCE